MFGYTALAVLYGLGRVKLTLQVGMCSFVVIDPSDLGTTNVVAQALCLTIFNLPPRRKPAFFWC